MSDADPAEVAARFVAAQESLLTELERAAGAPGAGTALDRASARCAEAFERFRALHEAGVGMPVDTVARARRLASLLSARAEAKSDDVSGELLRTRQARRLLDSTESTPPARLGGSCDMAG